MKKCFEIDGMNYLAHPTMKLSVLKFFEAVDAAAPYDYNPRWMFSRFKTEMITLDELEAELAWHQRWDRGADDARMLEQAAEEVICEALEEEFNLKQDRQIAEEQAKHDGAVVSRVAVRRYLACQPDNRITQLALQFTDELPEYETHQQMGLVISDLALIHHDLNWQGELMPTLKAMLEAMDTVAVNETEPEYEALSEAVNKYRFDK